MIVMFNYYCKTFIAYYKLIPLEPYYGLQSIDVENFISPDHTVTAENSEWPVFNYQLPLFLVWCAERLSYSNCGPQKKIQPWLQCKVETIFHDVVRL